MNVDCKNFYSVVQMIDSHSLVDRSSTISFDLEFTGLKMDNNDKQRYDEFLFERYDKLRNIAIKYSIIQIGLCFFIEENQKIIAYPFNFYVFPRGYKNINPVICLQSTTVDFNSRNGMDWNRWIKQGITYIQLAKQEEASYTPEKAPLQELEKKLTSEQIHEMAKIITSLKQFEQQSEKNQIQLQVSSTFVRLIVERNIQKDFRELYLTPYLTDSSLKQKLLLKIRKLKPGDRKTLQKQTQLDLIGFTEIFRKIIGCKAKLVGHNSFFDLLYIYQSFMEDLPEDYFHFKKNINKVFPNFFDTKYLSNEGRFKQILNGTSIEDIHEFILKNQDKKFHTIEISLAQGFQGYDWKQSKNNKLHEAGYDAYLTGWIFYHLIQEEQLQKFKSKLKIVWSMYDMNLSQQQDSWNNDVRNIFSFVLALRKPKQPVAKVFEYKKNVMNSILDKIKLMPTNFELSKEDIKYKQCRLDYLVLECRNNLKRKQFVSAVHSLGTEGVDILSMSTFLKERRVAFEKQLAIEGK